MPVVRCDIEDRLARVTLSRPEKLNALSEDVRRELDGHLRTLADRPEVSVVVISGEGRAFSAGADLTVSLDGGSGSPSWVTRRHAYGGWQRLLELLESVPQVTVASVHGHCIGGAALLAAACDIRVAAMDVQVRIPELAIGIPLTWAGVPRLIREVGLPVARDMVMTGRVLGADEALACGFVQRLATDLQAATEELIGELLAMPPGPLAMTRSMFAAIGRQHIGATAWADADVLAWSFTEAEALEAGMAYRSRRRGPAS